MFNRDNLQLSLELLDPYSPTLFKIKFGDLSGGGLKFHQFQHLVKHLANLDSNKTLTTAYYNHHTRKSHLTNMDTESIVWHRQKTINYLHNTDYNLHFFIVQTSSIEPQVNFEATLRKEKIKSTYQLTDDIKLVLSEVTTTATETSTLYEVEVNFTDIKHLSYIETMIKDILLILNNTEVLYTEKQRLAMVHDCQKILHLPPSKDLDNIFVQCHPIKFNELNQLEGEYVVSAKAKGFRNLMIIHSTGIWLVKPKLPYHYNLIISFSSHLNISMFGYLFHSWNTTIFDGELVKPIHQTATDFNYKYWYLAYDCLVFNKSDIRQLRYAARIDYALTFQRILPWYVDGDYLTFGLQTTRGINDSNTSDRNARIDYILNLSKQLNYKHTGLIFTPANLGYDNDLKFKYLYPKDTTIDFAIYDSGHPEFLKLYVYDDDLKMEVEFTGTPELPFDSNLINQSSLLPIYNKKRVIAECSWDRVLNQMHFVSIRDDKTKADDLNLAVENWENMNDGCPAL